MNHKQISTQFFDNGIRIECILHLATMCHDYAFPSEAEEAFTNDPEAVWPALGLPDPETDSGEEISEILFENGKLGFLVKFATPVPTFHSAESSSSCGWGYYTMQWVYAETFEDAIAKGIAWQSEYLEQQKIKQIGAA